MFEQIFLDIPQVELLQWLARGSLKQNLMRAIRLWVWLRSLYGETQHRLLLDDPFTYAQWRDAFFTSTHPKTEAIPQMHDRHCACAKTTSEWLFTSTGLLPSDWKRSLLTHTGIETSVLEQLLQQRLFGVTRRSLQADLEILAEQGWLVYKNQKYHRVNELPLRPRNPTDESTATKLSTYELNFLNQEDLAQIAQNHSQKINGVQRFFLKLDYVIPRATLDLVDDWQYQLRHLWTQTPVPPINLTYNSARVGNTVDCIVYPVCIYYVQRAVYLCAYGESPNRETDWYNFRLDRIHKMVPLEWTNPGIGKRLRQCYQKASLPTPDYIALEMSKAWGFDFYLPVRLMLVRFDREYHDRYIQNTFRHETFMSISYQQAQRLIHRAKIPPEHQQGLLEVLANRSPQDAYYRVFYRHRDNNVMMRLRAWRPKCEVFFPWDLRQRIAADVTAEFQLYHQPKPVLTSISVLPKD
ncbi:MAG: TIGR03985 family CRISPR-associated protein [Nostocaceae cyanobacterium]|nr:TIGR03985 family CRISPR-associated protein [Nostocaceae cyanobacterium]